MFSGDMSDEIDPARDAVPVELSGWRQLNLAERSGKSEQSETIVQGTFFSPSKLNQTFIKKVGIL